MDAFARGLKIARAIMADGRLAAFVQEHIKAGTASSAAASNRSKAKFRGLEAYILPKGDAAKNSSGRQEMLENLINDFI